LTALQGHIINTLRNIGAFSQYKMMCAEQTSVLLVGVINRIHRGPMRPALVAERDIWARGWRPTGATRNTSAAADHQLRSNLSLPSGDPARGFECVLGAAPADVDARALRQRAGDQGWSVPAEADAGSVLEMP
jgi:hypothetical protein